MICFNCHQKPATKTCSRCKLGRYCGPECQRAAWKRHKIYCKAELAERRVYELESINTVQVGESEIFIRQWGPYDLAELLDHAELAPIPNHVGEPIAVYHIDHKYGGADNMMACYHMVDLKTGLAPRKWQSRVGNVLVARTDFRNHCVRAFEDMHSYCYDAMDYYEDQPNQVPSALTRAHWLRYREREREMRDGL
eukprot:TRINITY_DN17232_c0_g1_i1.p2 TRINITY_DN17232_c0_g1~~TRINITY_DN17232_c0_g1_i1.p2  ORF type:complete len:195 (+),score=25.46 TRINITY_DN17232_c0_g1_i1:171-755(+)